MARRIHRRGEDTAHHLKREQLNGACGPSEARSRRASASGGGAPRAIERRRGCHGTVVQAETNRSQRKSSRGNRRRAAVSRRHGRRGRPRAARCPAAPRQHDANCRRHQGGRHCRVARVGAAGCALRSAPDAQDPGAGAGRRAVPGDWPGRQHRDLQPGRCGASETVAGERTGLTGDRRVDQRRISTRLPDHQSQRRVPNDCRRPEARVIDPRIPLPASGA